MFSYCAYKIKAPQVIYLTVFAIDGIAAAAMIAIVNYVLLGFQFPVDGFYLHSFEIWLATTVVFWGSGNIGYTLLEYRLGHKELVSENHEQSAIACLTFVCRFLVFWRM